MRKFTLCAGAIAAFALVLMTNQSRSQTASDFRVADEISVDGPALFYGVSGEFRRELWAVNCAMPLRSCVARAPGLVLRIDDQGQPHLVAAVSPGARISIHERNTTQDHPHLFGRPLPSDIIRRLSEEKTAVVIEEQGRVVLRSSTAGIDRVIDYLTWVQGNTARTLRDARLWPRNQEMRIQDMTPEVLERYEVMQRRAVEAQRQVVPSTKPQIEFAIRAQEGDSFYGPTGKSDTSLWP